MGDFSFQIVFHGEPTLEGIPAGLKHGDTPMEFVTVCACSDLVKADHESIPPGSRWITVRPNGEGSKGVPVLVQEHKKGSGVWHVIGGAGGKLNYLKIRGVKSEGEYKQAAAEKQNAKREAAKDQKARDKELGLDHSKKEARENVARQRKDAEREHINTVAGAMGWDKKELEFNEEAHSHLSEAAQAKARNSHHSELLKRATEAVDMQRKMLVADEDSRRAAEIGELPLESTDDDQLSVDDIMPTKVPDGAGFSAAFSERAKENGLSDDELKSELDSIRDERTGGLDSEKRAAAVRRGEAAKLVRDELSKVQAPKPDLKAKLTDAKKAVELLKSEKKMKALQKSARQAGKEIDTSAIEPKAYVLQSADATDDDVAKEVEDKLRTARTHSFLSEVDRIDPSGDSLDGHIAAGAFNAINSVSLAVGGVSMLDRSAVDVLGVAGAAQVLARKLRGTMGKDIDRVTEGLEDFHTQHYMKLSAEALREAHELQDIAKELSLGEAEHAGDIVEAAAINRKKKEALAASNKVLGQALGEMEANAALVMALKDNRDNLQVSLGKTSPENAIKQIRALGLQRGDYKIEQAGGNTFLTLNAAGMDKVAGDPDPENAARVQRNLDIMKGKQDEDDWLPQGFAKRPDLAMANLKPGVAPSLAIPFSPSGDLEQSLKDYIGGRAADGDRAADILADIQSADFFQKAGDATAYRAALDSVAPNKDSEKSMKRVERLEGLFNGYADSFVKDRYGSGVSAMNSQNIEPDEVAQDALHRALCDEPAGVAAYKPIGELDHHDQKALRDFFAKNVARESEEAAGMRQEYERLGESEPEKTVTDMFGDETESPEWVAWKSSRDELAEKLNSSSLTWPKYSEMMRGHENAYAAVQDLIRSRVSDSFAKNYNTLNPGKPIKVGRGIVRGNLNHLDAVNPAAREKRLSEERDLVDSLRERDGGKYASGRVADKLDAARDQKEAFSQSQMGFFADDLFGDSAEKVDRPLGDDERHTLGHAAERTIANMVQTVGKNFKPGQPVKLFQPTMSGKDGAARQRAIKLICQNKRQILGLGVGSGKTAVMLGAMAQLHSEGKIKKSIFAVPSIVQGQFGGEALRFLEPNKFKWHCEPGGTRESRIAAYKDPDTHFVVATHQSFRDDLLHMAGGQESIEPEAVADKMSKMSKPERAAYIKGVLGKEGISFDFAALDEAHGLLNRDGKENSRMANVIEGVTDNAEFYAHASGDPVKNDSSEAFDLLSKMDGERYSDKAAFMRKYGGDTQASKDGLRRELARHLYADSITPDVKVDSREQRVPLSPEQKAALGDVTKHVAAAKVAKLEGRTDVQAMRALVPQAFEGSEESKHEEIAKGLTDSLGIVKSSAIRRVLDNHPTGGKMDAIVKMAGERKGKPGVVFAHSLEAVESLKKRLEAEGHRVVTITGKDSGKDKAAKIQAFNPDKGERTADIVVASDAGATGANLQSGQWLTQFDTANTAMVHAQRRGRINRIGQKNNIELVDLISDHPEEDKARKRLKDKYALRDVVTSPLDGIDDTGVAGFLNARKAEQNQNSLF